MGFLNDHAVASAISFIFVVWLSGKIAVLIKYRKRFHKLPGPPHDLLFGSLISMGKIAQKLPKRAHPHLLFVYMMREYDLPSVYFVDNEPISDSMLVVADPELAREVSESDLFKNPLLNDFIGPIAGMGNLVTSEGALWKKWRGIFNPGFSVQQLVSQVPAMVDCTQAFIDILDQHAAAVRVFRMEEEATKLAIDVIGKVVCDHDFKSLTTDNEFLETMRKTLTWMPDPQSLNPWHKKNPLRPLFQKYYKWKMDKYVGKMLDERFAVKGNSISKKSKQKTSIDLALYEYAKESGQDVDAHAGTMDAEFRRFAINNLLVLLFAGHDTTASTICYCYHLLHKHPDTLAKVRQELDDIFGVGVSANEQLRDNPYLVNKCQYTLAVIKETLRLWTPASSSRIGKKGSFLKNPLTGDMIDTEGISVWISSMSIHRNAKFWGPDVDEFKPERFLPENADKLPPHAFRPFEAGPRNCIGSELALIEMKVVLAMTLREFDVRAAYDELDTLSKDGSLWANEKSFRMGPQEVFGEPMYQILLAAGKPREGMPARVTRRKL